MQNLTNYHSHTEFCDGQSSMENFIQTAIQKGFYSYGFSPHAPLPFQTDWTMDDQDMVKDYLNEFTRLKDKYGSEIEIYSGLEIDFLDEENNPASDFFQKLPLDYRIGSVHMLYNPEGQIVDVDCDQATFKQNLKLYFDNDLQYVVTYYYNQLLHMIDLGGFDFIGHADKISNNASYCQADIREQLWYEKIIENYFETIASKKIMLEINTKRYNKCGVFFPNQKYFSLLHELKIPVIVNSDSHYSELMNNGRKEAMLALKKAGISSVMELKKGVWTESEIICH